MHSSTMSRKKINIKIVWRWIPWYSRILLGRYSIFNQL